MRRYFTRDQAERLLPEVRIAITEAVRSRQEYGHAEEEWRQLQQRLQMLGGATLNPVTAAEIKSRRETSASRLKECLEQIQEIGCDVKDLDVGLVDFPTLYQGREVCLCWRMDEDAIRFWHGTDEGYRGRKPIDDDFLAEHRGDSPQ